MSATRYSPPPVPFKQATTSLGEQPIASPVSPAALDRPTQVLGTDSTRVDADFCGHHLRVHGVSLREISARISTSSGTADHCAAFDSRAVA